MPNFYAVVPCRWDSSNNLFCDKAEGHTDKDTSQTDWEYFYIEMAMRFSREHQGSVIFWLPTESLISPRQDGNPYARDTYGELGRWGKCASMTNGKIFIGAESGFPGLKVIRKNLRRDFQINKGDEFQIYKTLEETVDKAVEWVTG